MFYKNIVILNYLSFKNNLCDYKSLKILLPALAVVLFIISIIPVSYALPDLSNQQVIGDSSSDGQIILEFTDNSYLYLTNSVITTTNLDFAYIESDSGTFVLEDTETRVLGDSFRVLSKDPPALLYGKSLGNENYKINFYTVNNGLFEKTIFDATLEDIQQRDTFTIVETRSSIMEEKKNLIVDSSSSLYGEFYDNFNIRVQVWDADINPNPLLFSKTDGLLPNVPVKAILTNPNGDQIVTLEGITDNLGLYQGQYRWGYNDVAGEYHIALSVDNDGDYTEELKTFYRGYVAPDRKSVNATNSTGP